MSHSCKYTWFVSLNSNVFLVITRLCMFKCSWGLGITFLQTIINLKARGNSRTSCSAQLWFTYLSLLEDSTIGLMAWPCCINSGWRMAQWHTGASFCRAVPTWLTASTTASWSQNLEHWQCQTHARVSLGASCHALRCHVRGFLRNKKCSEIFLGNLWFGLKGDVRKSGRPILSPCFS